MSAHLFHLLEPRKDVGDVLQLTSGGFRPQQKRTSLSRQSGLKMLASDGGKKKGDAKYRGEK